MSLSKFQTEKVLSVHHWNDTLFSFTTTRRDGLRFENGHFLMIGLPVDGKPLLRAYSIVSPNYAEHLEFLSIKVQDGPLTSRLQHLKWAMKSSWAASQPVRSSSMICGLEKTSFCLRRERASRLS
jgi:ferredoxin-NADP reductase